jgi:hypothetical protein
MVAVVQEQLVAVGELVLAAVQPYALAVLA